VIKNILWDFDGVILDSMQVRDYGFRCIFSKYHKDLVDEFIQYHRLNGGLSRFHKIKYFYNNLLSKEISEEQIQLYADKFSSLMKTKLTNIEYLIEDSIKFIKENYKIYNFYIVSGSEHNELNYLCDKLDVSKYFIDICGSPVPKNELVNNLLKKRHCKNEETILIGDSINDYEAAQINNIKFCGFNNNSLIKKSFMYIYDFNDIKKLDHFEKYKLLKNHMSINYRGINLSTVASTKLIMYSYYPSSIKIKHLLKNLFRRMSFKNILNKDIKDKSLITYSVKRIDYMNLINVYVSKLGFKKYNIKDASKVKKRLYISITHLSRIVQFFIQLKESELKLIEKLYLFSLIVYYKNSIDNLIDNNKNIPSSYYSFNSSFGNETILTEYLNLKNVPTFTFQHGSIFNFNYPIPLDVINYENIVSKKVLCWSQYSIDELLKYGFTQDRLVLFGNYKYYYDDFNINIPKQINKVIVFLSRGEYNNGNKKLIEILGQLKDINFDIKLHPTLSHKDFCSFVDGIRNLNILNENNKKTIKKLLSSSSYDIAITYNTTVHYEACACGKVTFGYNFRQDGSKLFESFYNIDELKYLMLEYSNKNISTVTNKLKSFCQYTLGT